MLASNHRHRKMNKGIGFIVGAVVFTFLVMIALIMPFFALKVHIQRTIIFETNYNNAQLSLLSLISSTHKDSLDNTQKTVYNIISEYMSLTNKPDVSFLNTMLKDLVESQTYKLYYLENGQEKILAKNGDPSAFEANTLIVVPYNSDKLFKDLQLVIN